MFFNIIVVLSVIVGVIGQININSQRIQLKQSQSDRTARQFRDPIIKSLVDNVNKQRFVSHPHHQLESRTTIFFPGTNNNQQQQQQQQQIIYSQPQQVQQIEKNLPIEIAPLEFPVFPKMTPITTKPKIEIPQEIQKEEELTEEELREQAQSAHYSFDSKITDSINDHAISRQETRDGLALTGMYSYSDGFFRRTVHYAADEDGYRVLKEEIEPIGDGPKFNIKGKADVSSSLAGSYSITAADINMRHREESI